MPLVGDVKRFAIEYESDENRGEGKWTTLRLVYWCGGRCLGGDDNYHAYLMDTFIQLERIKWDNGKRLSPRFAGLSSGAIYAALRGALFNGADEEIANEEQWARFAVSRASISPDWDVFLIDTEQSSRLIFGNRKLVEEVVLTPGEFDAVLQRVVVQLGADYERLVTPAEEVPE